MKIKLLSLFACLLLVGVAFARPKKAATKLAPITLTKSKAPIPVHLQPAHIVKGATSAGTVSATATLDYGNLEFAQDGSDTLRVFINLNGANRTRVLTFSTQPASDAGAGGTQVVLDGTVTMISNGVCQGTLFGTAACTSLTNLATQILNAPTKITNVLSAPAIQSILVAP